MTKRRAESEIAKSEEPTRRVPSLSVDNGSHRNDASGGAISRRRHE